MSSDAVRRILAEVREFIKINSAPTSFFYAAPLESDLFEWHFSVRGPPDTVFAEGVYHGRILLPTEYPLKAPEIIMLTPNGRFEVGKRICLSVTSHHQETWQPSWGIRTILTALVGFMPSKAEGVGALDYPDEDRIRLARKSHDFVCPICGAVPSKQLPPRQQVGSSSADGSGIMSSDAIDSSESNDDNEIIDAVDETTGHESDAENETLPDAEQNADTPNVLGPNDEIGENVKRTGESSTMVRDKEPEGEIIQDDTTIQTDGDTNRDAIAESVGPITSHRQEEPRRFPPRTEVEVGPTNLNRESGQEGVQEKELLYVAYAIVAMMAAVIIRRVINSLTS